MPVYVMPAQVRVAPGMGPVVYREPVRTVVGGDV